MTGKIEQLSFVKRTVNIRRHKNPYYKKDFLPKNWRKPFRATIKWRPKPTYLFEWKKGAGMVAGIQQFTNYGAQGKMLKKKK